MPSITSDIFEQIAELGGSTVKKAGQSMKQVVSPKALWEQVTGSSSENSDKAGMDKLKKEAENKKGFTQLDFNKLQDKFSNKDKILEQILRAKLFQMVKGGEQKVMQDNKQKENEKVQQEAYQAQEKKKQEAQLRQQQSQGGAPRGKERKSIFSHKKVAERQQIEVKVNTGKQ